MSQWNNNNYSRNGDRTYSGVRRDTSTNGRANSKGNGAYHKIPPSLPHTPAPYNLDVYSHKRQRTDPGYPAPKLQSPSQSQSQIHIQSPSQTQLQMQPQPRFIQPGRHGYKNGQRYGVSGHAPLQHMYNYQGTNGFGYTGTVRTRVYSDFRVARTKIGSFEVVERQGASSRDSRLRLYFGNSNNDPATALGSGNLSVNPNGMSRRDRALAEPDRLSISLNQGTRRIVIPVQDGLDKVRFNRKEGYFRILSRGWALFEKTESGGVPGQFRRCEDFTQDQLQLSGGVIEVWIDLKNPLAVEPKWTRGNLVDYIDSRSKFLTHHVLSVEDPDRVVDFDSFVGLWIKESSIGAQVDRAEFVATELSKIEYMLELTSKVLAPPNYYISKSAGIKDASSQDGSNSGSDAPSQIPALISPSVNALIATTYMLAMRADEQSQDLGLITELGDQLKTVLYQTPEPIVWRALDGMFAKRREPLVFNAQSVIDSMQVKSRQKAAAFDDAVRRDMDHGTESVVHEDGDDDIVDYGANNAGDVYTEHDAEESENEDEEGMELGR